MRMPRSFYRQSPIALAQALLGRRLVRLWNGHRLAVRLVETEAYLGVPDLAAHTSGGRRTARNEAMFLDAGHLYVYFTYGMHHCMNIVAAGVDEPVAVLLRAGEPVEGLDAIKEARPKARRLVDLCSGPARLCQALRVDLSLNRLDLTDSDSPLFVEDDPKVDRNTITSQSMAGPRVGVDYAGDWAHKPLRFFLADDPHVSGSRQLQALARRVSTFSSESDFHA